MRKILLSIVLCGFFASAMAANSLPQPTMPECSTQGVEIVKTGGTTTIITDDTVVVIAPDGTVVVKPR